jgi:hypothetical protein
MQYRTVLVTVGTFSREDIFKVNCILIGLLTFNIRYRVHNSLPPPLP